MKTCYYELLGVEFTASDSDLRKAYRRKALQYHPDKNPEDIEAATAVFATIRAAYEVLSDAQERAWYDAHKNQILSDEKDAFDDGYGDGNEYEVDGSITGITTDDLLKFFNSGLYSRIDDSPAGLYQIAGKVFAKLASEEVKFGRVQGLDKYDKYEDQWFETDILESGYKKAFEKYTSKASMLFPAFGDSTASFEHLRTFYRHWSSFSTVKTFSWKDEYMYSRNYDRRTKREIGKRNEKLRQQARSEYNKTVKRYVTFIKKFDSRMREGSAKFEQEKRRKMREDLQRQIEKDREARSQIVGDPFKLQTWQTVDDFDWSEIEKNYDRNDNLTDDEEKSKTSVVIFECFVCGKTFKSEKQLENHNSTKVHKKNLQQIQREMRKDNMTLGLDAVSDAEDFDSAAEDTSENAGKLDLDEIESELQRIERELEGICDDDDEDDSSLDDISSEALSQTSELGLNSEQVKVDVEVDQIDVSDSVSDLEDEELSKLLDSLTSNRDKIHSDKAESSDEWDISKRTKKNHKVRTTEAHNKPSVSEPSSQFACQKCSGTYQSRNALFDHIKRENHAAAFPKQKLTKKSKDKAKQR
ncbi:Jjj1p LALA0_S07e04676g [Lachancea lanzarotensis]|uniref:LALA0S07e04676g1_1 n=1 Tax=Lachancea lanzarotensis TaxID=1245769 RepID=A0A0C7N5I1_9SACH|nr:uncharacterized protein LALA0_S07e04676g [Lachancea lanzarotensis]CEP63198.1 LALA0S07e04676g1_1 [Lachancea lanzarotensis]